MPSKKKVYLYQKRRKRRRLKPVPILVLLIIVLAMIAAVVSLVISGGSSESADAPSENEVLRPHSIMEEWEQKQQELEEQKKEEEEKNRPGAYASFGEPVPESAAVDMSYFEDALFVGDSRSEGFKLYAEVDKATYYVYRGLSVETVNTKEVIPGPDGSKQTVVKALENKEFGKVYVMLGINELGWPNRDVFIEKYGKLIDAIKKNNPDAIVYVQSILPVSAKKASDPVYNNENVDSFNELIKAMTVEKEVFYVNSAEAVSDETGALAADASTDGIHLSKNYCMLWRDYLMTHKALIK